MANAINPITVRSARNLVIIPAIPWQTSHGTLSKTLKERDFGVVRKGLMSLPSGRGLAGVIIAREDCMRVAMLALAGAFLFAGTAAYAADPMAGTYGNTVTTKNSKTGAVGTLLFNADGTYTASGTGSDGKAVTYPGKWVTKDAGATLCLTPVSASAESCSPLSIHPVGEHWNVTDTAGDSFDVVVTAGR
jgi:hypothetical protein